MIKFWCTFQFLSESTSDKKFLKKPSGCDFRAIALRRVLARVPEEMSDRRTFLETIKEIASSIKKLLDATNAVMQVVHPSAQLCVLSFSFTVKIGLH